MRTATKTRRPKTKRSYTLSPESVAFLEGLRKRRRAASTSSVLEEIVQAARRRGARAAIEKSVSDYYSSLSAEEMREQSEWGEFAMSQFPDEP
jgi:hypothetical protein